MSRGGRLRRISTCRGTSPGVQALLSKLHSTQGKFPAELVSSNEAAQSQTLAPPKPYTHLWTPGDEWSPGEK